MPYIYPLPAATAHELTRSCLPEPGRVLHTLLDTDAANEIDDQFAIAHLVLSPERFKVHAITAAPFRNPQVPLDRSAAMSYDEVQRVLSYIPGGGAIPVTAGAAGYLRQTAGKPNRAAEVIVELARARTAADPLFVLAIGVATNVAAALEQAPDIREKVVVCWLGAHPYAWPVQNEYNFEQDIPAARVLFESGVRLIHVPCKQIAELLLTTIPELEANMDERIGLCRFLLDRTRNYTKEPRGWSKTIWDVATVAVLLNHAWVPTIEIPALSPADAGGWKPVAGGHKIRVAMDIQRDPIFRDIFQKFAKLPR